MGVCFCNQYRNLVALKTPCEAIEHSIKQLGAKGARRWHPPGYSDARPACTDSIAEFEDQPGSERLSCYHFAPSIRHDARAKWGGVTTEQRRPFLQNNRRPGSAPGAAVSC